MLAPSSTKRLGLRGPGRDTEPGAGGSSSSSTSSSSRLSLAPSSSRLSLAPGFMRPRPQGGSNDMFSPLVGSASTRASLSLSSMQLLSPFGSASAAGSGRMGPPSAMRRASLAPSSLSMLAATPLGARTGSALRNPVDDNQATRMPSGRYPQFSLTLAKIEAFKERLDEAEANCRANVKAAVREHENHVAQERDVILTNQNKVADIRRQIKAFAALRQQQAQELAEIDAKHAAAHDAVMRAKRIRDHTEDSVAALRAEIDKVKAQLEERAAVQARHVAAARLECEQFRALLGLAITPVHRGASFSFTIEGLPHDARVTLRHGTDTGAAKSDLESVDAAKVACTECFPPVPAATLNALLAHLARTGDMFRFLRSLRRVWVAQVRKV
ncbi:hypothetical protein H9P43_000799 [Blastocladiella emersonii ATCC 22665]|nr:hypothetical protein H9P43_000799 [Blastocladiella emersonii ATCC 22665]